MGVYVRFFSRFWVYNINIESPDNHSPKTYFVFSFKPWYDGGRDDMVIDKTANHLDTVLILEVPEFVIMVTTDELGPYHILESSV